MGGEWKVVEVVSATTRDKTFFPVSDPLSYRIENGQLTIGRNEVCDAYLWLQGPLVGASARGSYFSLGLGEALRSATSRCARPGDPRQDVEVPNPDGDVHEPVVEVPAPGRDVRRLDVEVPNPGGDVRNPGIEVPDLGGDVRNPDVEVLNLDRDVRNLDAKVSNPDGDVRWLDGDVPNPGEDVRKPGLRHGESPRAELPRPTGRSRRQ